MKFRQWLEASKPALPFNIRLSALYGWEPKVKEAWEDVREGRLSFHKGEAIVVSKLTSPKGGYFVIDGHHRVIEAILDKGEMITGVINEYLPNIDHGGDSYRNMLDNKCQIAEFVARTAST